MNKKNNKNPQQERDLIRQVDEVQKNCKKPRLAKEFLRRWTLYNLQFNVFSLSIFSAILFFLFLTYFLLSLFSRVECGKEHLTLASKLGNTFFLLRGSRDYNLFA